MAKKRKKASKKKARKRKSMRPVPIKSGKPVRRRKKSKKKAWNSCPSTIKKTSNPIPLKVLECRLDKLNRIVKKRGGKGL